MAASLKKTPLYDLHVRLGAKMVPFAGYEMPVQYPTGVLKEHLHTREKAGLFDVSHIGQAFLKTTRALIGSDEAHQSIAASLETLTPGEIIKLKKGGMRYSLLLNAEGGVLDDLMITRPFNDDRQGYLFLVVNAAVKDDDFALISLSLKNEAELEIADDRALLAIQGPAAARIVDGLLPGAADQRFMTMRPFDWRGAYLIVSRCGYTGEDGFEISVPNERAEELAEILLADDALAPIGLGARDSLRLEAGLCLYGHDMDKQTTPVEANLNFAIGKRRREEGGFPGARKILDEFVSGPERLRVGLSPQGKAPAREGVEIQSTDGRKIGVVTSGGFGPSAGGPIAMGYVESKNAATGTLVQLMIRGKPAPAEIVEMPFVPHRYFRG